ncbi:hypothetical protein D3C78_19020 [compost metagenome]
MIDKLVSKFEAEFNKKIGELSVYSKQRDKLLREIREIDSDARDPIEMNKLVTETLEEFRAEYAQQYAAEVTNGLTRTIIHNGQEARCIIGYSTDGKQMLIQVEITHENGKTLVGSPEDIEGGGARDVMGVVFLFSYIHRKPQLTGPVWVDEPTKQLSDGYSAPFYSYLQDIKNEIPNQIIMATHDLSIISDARFSHNVIELRLNQDGSTQILTPNNSV